MLGNNLLNPQNPVNLSMRLFLLSILLLSTCTLAAQYSYQSYSPANGLVDARVQKMFQDSRGILYFLTLDGFSSFDGQRFTDYTQVNNQLLSIVNDMLEIEKGHLLISAISGIYHLHNQQLYKDSTFFKQVAEPGDFLPTERGQFLLPSASGLYHFTGKTATCITSGETSQLNSLDKMIREGDYMAGIGAANTKWADKLILYNWKTEQLTDELPVPGISNILQFNHTLFVQTGKAWQQLNQTSFKRGTLSLEPLYFRQQIPKDFEWQQFYINRQQELWLIHPAKGLYKLNPKTGIMNWHKVQTGLMEGVQHIFEDAENNHWLIAPGKGVQKLVQSNLSRFTINGIPQSASSLHTNTEGITVIGRKDTIATAAANKWQYSVLPGKFAGIQSFYWNGQLWRLLREGAIESVSGKKINLAAKNRLRESISYKISFDGANRLLISGDCLTVINQDYTQWTITLPYFTDRVLADEQDHYWCFARNNTITAYRLAANGLQKIASFTDARYSARDVLRWNADTFCIGTRNKGLVMVKAGTNGYQYLGAITSARGLSNDFVTGIIKMNNRQLLAATVTGLDRIHFYPTDTTVEQLYGSIHLFNGVTNLATLNDHTILSLNDDGSIYQFDLQKQPATNFQPALFFNRILVNGEATDSLQHSFTYNRNNFRFLVSAPSFMDEKNIRFYFRLNSSELTKEQQGLSGDFDIANLPPGNYRLQVTAYFPGDRYAPSSISYMFNIQKPFWKTTGFLLAAIALLLLGIYALFRSMLRRKLLQQKIQLEKEKAIAGERTRIATDMHDELGAGISTIKYLSQSAPFIALGVQKENNLKIAAQADELVDKMNDIIWAMNENNDTLDNLLYYCKAWIVEYCDAHQLKPVIIVPDTIPNFTVRGEVRQDIFLCIKESVHNIIKHANASDMQVAFILLPKQLNITISDNGKGFDQQKIKHGNGLFNIEKRIGRLKGSLHIESSGGTRLNFSIPL
jgi:signal transduction histidine kinase